MESRPVTTVEYTFPGPWEKYRMALDDVTARLERITHAFERAAIPYALVGGQAVAIWVATRDPAAVRTTKDVDVLLQRQDLAAARAAALSAGLEYFELMGVGMFLEKTDSNPRKAVHVVWASEKVRPEYPLPSPGIQDRQLLEPGKHVVTLPGLVMMKLMANRDQDRVHLRDLIDVGLVGRDQISSLPPELAARLDTLLTEAGR
jgi:nucleotidyltransferase AbiEii toxin of type IV toxin-antitoxin system